MFDIPDKDVAMITVASAIIRFFLFHRVPKTSMLIRCAPDILVDLIGKEECKARIKRGARNTVFGIRILSDPEMEWGTVIVGWKQ
jgi:hypothetical protein